MVRYPMSVQQHLERLEPFLGDDETRIDGYATETEIGVLTGRRLLSLETTDADERTTTVETTYLDRLGGATIEHETPPDVQEDALGYGLVSLVVALVSVALFGVVDADGLAAVLLLVGIGVGFMGLLLLFEAYNTPDGGVRIELRTETGDVARRLRLDEDHRSFAETLSKTVSNAHEPRGPVTQTVGQ